MEVDASDLKAIWTGAHVREEFRRPHPTIRRLFRRDQPGPTEVCLMLATWMMTLRVWSRPVQRLRHLSLHRSDWERCDPFVLTLHTPTAVRAMEFMSAVVSGRRWMTEGGDKSPTLCIAMTCIHPLRDVMGWIITALARRDPDVLRNESPLVCAMDESPSWVIPLLDHGFNVNHASLVLRAFYRLGVADFKAVVARADETALNGIGMSQRKTPLARAATSDLTIPDNAAKLRVLLDRVHGDGSGVDMKAITCEVDAAEWHVSYRSAECPILLWEVGLTLDRIHHWRRSLPRQLMDALRDVLSIGPLIVFVKEYVMPQHAPNILFRDAVSMRHPSMLRDTYLRFRSDFLTPPRVPAYIPFPALVRPLVVGIAAVDELDTSSIDD
jgi:hypothetical protein